MPTVRQFHTLWRELHLRPQSSNLRSTTSEIAFLTRFANRIPCGGCRKHWLETVAKIPPDFSSRSAYFAWTVRAHNAVNRLLGKPVLTLRRARSVWNFR